MCWAQQCPKSNILVVCSLEYRGEGSSGEGCLGAPCGRLAHPQHARLERGKDSNCMKTHRPRCYIGSHLTEPHQSCSTPVIHSSRSSRKWLSPVSALQDGSEQSSVTWLLEITVQNRWVSAGLSVVGSSWESRSMMPRPRIRFSRCRRAFTLFFSSFSTISWGCIESYCTRCILGKTDLSYSKALVMHKRDQVADCSMP